MLARASPYIVLAAVFCLFVEGHGTPALRHDWLFPVDTASFIQRMSDLGTGWSAGGLGQPNAYPMTYIVVWPLALVALLFGTPVALTTLVAAVAVSVVFAGERLARRLQLPFAAAVALDIFLLFNPWTYSKVVAGHLTQIMAYTGTLLAANELLEEDADARRLSLAMILTALQTQFWLIALFLCATCVKRRAARFAILTGLIVFLPSTLGIALDRDSLLGLPFTIAWENTQSVPMLDGLMLRGYFPHYADQAFSPLGSMAVLIFAGLAAAAPFLYRTRAYALTAAAACATLIVASGTTGWLSLAWRWAIVHAPAVGVYRELYDLVALVAICYALLAAATLRRLPAANWIACIAAVTLVALWFRSPPSEQWVAAQSLPGPGPELSSAGRYATMPPFQPVSYRGHGSGVDPLYVGPSAAQAPLNAFLPFFPANTALEKFWLFGDGHDLERLGVSVVECRQGFSEAVDAVNYYGVRSNPTVCSGPEQRLAAEPVVSIAAGARLCSLCSVPAAGNVFIGDARRLPNAPYRTTQGWFRPVGPAREFVRPQDGWIDGRLQFTREPWLGQPLGGAFTSQANSGLPADDAPFVLANVRGRLSDDRGRIVSGSTEGYRWLRLQPQVGRLYCTGDCLVAGFGDPDGVALDPTPLRADRLDSATILPWLVKVVVPARTHGVLRFVETYDGGWTALRLPGPFVLPHVRLDASLNGWIVAPSAQPSDVWLVHIVSLFQAVTGAVGLGWALLVGFRRSFPATAASGRRTLESG